MEVFPVAFVFFAIFIVARIRGPEAGFIAAMAILPLGALAFLNIGNFSLIAYHSAFILMIGLAYVGRLISPTRHQIPRLELAGTVFMILAFYALLTSQLMPRLFAGDVWVFSLQSDVVGQRVSPYFISTVSLLEPSSGNISQPVYFFLSALVFVLTLRMARKHGSRFLNRSVAAAAAVNGLMGTLDFFGADEFLALFKTAEYSFMTDVGIAGVIRIVGVYPEASSMGGISAILFAYMIMRYLDTGKMLTLLLAGLNLLWAILALSSTGFVAVAVAGAFVLWRSGTLNLSSRINPRTAIRLLLFGIVVAVSVVFIGLFTSAGETAWLFIEKLILQKGSTLSALERGAWARQGLKIGFETYGLGAGLGSTRSNGLISVLFSNIGVIGIILYGIFLFSVLRARRPEFKTESDLALYNAAAAGIVTSIAAQLISGTTAEPSIVFVVFCAIAVASRPAKYMKWVRFNRTNRTFDHSIAR